MRQKLKILAVDPLHPVFMEKLNSEKFELVYQPDIAAHEIPDALEGIDILIVRSKVFVSEALCIKANKLKLVARAGSGLDNLKVDWLDKAGIHVVNTPEANSNAVAEHTLGMLLNLLNNISKGDKEIRNFIWDREGNRGEELSGKTVGIIGFGHTGSAFARTLQGLGVEIMAYDKYKTGFGNESVREVTMQEIFNETDVLSLHIPLTQETTNLVNQHFIQKFKKDFVLLNLSRGGIVVTSDVIQNLENKKIRAFGSDVLRNEQITQLNNQEFEEFQTLLNFKNVILTPHVGGWTQQSYKKISLSLATKIEAVCDEFIQGETSFKEAQKFP